MARKGTNRWEIYNKETEEFITVLIGFDESKVDIFCAEMYPDIPIKKVLTKSKGNCSRYTPK